MDGILLEGNGTIDYSFVTGESMPEKIKPGKEIYAGGKHLGPPIKVEVLKTVSNSYLTQLWQQEENTQKEDPSLTMIVNKISRYFTFIVLTIAFSTALYWYFIDIDIMWKSFSAVLIIACPCALALASPFAYGHAMRLLGKKGIYLKDALIVEKLAGIKRIIWDKTGTLTSNFDAKAHFFGDDLTNEDLTLIKSATHNSMHPLSRLIYQSLPGNLDLKPLTSYNEIPGKGIEGKINGKQVIIGSASFIGMHANNKNDNESRVYLSVCGHLKGYYSFRQHYRSGIFQLLGNLGKRYNLHLLSGDNEGEKDNLKPYFDDLYFNQDPIDKKKFLTKFKGDEGTLMIGDGLNDAGALTEANVGIAVTTDTHQFTPACDIIYHANELPKLDQYLSFTRNTLTIVYIAFILSFLYNVAGLSFAITGHLTPLVSAILMPVSSVSVVLFVSLSVMKVFKRYFRK